MLGDADQALVELAALVVVEVAGEEVAFLGLAAEDVDPVQAVHVAVFQERQLVAKHHGGGALVAVKQGDVAPGLAGQHCLDDRQDRRDAAAGADAHVPALAFRVEFAVETALRRHDLQGVAGFQLLVGPGGENPAVDVLDADAQQAVVQPRADGIRSPYFFAVDLLAQGQVLALDEAKGVLEFLGHLETDHHRLVRGGPDAGDPERMEAGTHAALLNGT